MKISNELKLLLETGPVGKEDDGALKFIFKLPKEGGFTANFLDGTSVKLDVSTDDKSSGKFAFVTKGGKIAQSFDTKPSRDVAAEVLRRLKFAGAGGKLKTK